MKSRYDLNHIRCDRSTSPWINRAVAIINRGKEEIYRQAEKAFSRKTGPGYMHKQGLQAEKTEKLQRV